MKKIIIALMSVLLTYSCGGGQTENKNKDSTIEANYFDRDISVYLVGASGIDEKIVLQRNTKEYQYYTCAVIYDSNEWILEDRGYYKESYDENTKIVTCSLDNAKVKGNEELGTVHTVKIDLNTRTAQFISITNQHVAKEIIE